MASKSWWRTRSYHSSSSLGWARIEFDVIDKPHRKLGLAGARIPSPLRRIPCPAAMRIGPVPIVFQATRRHIQAGTDEIAVVSFGWSLASTNEPLTKVRG